MALVPPIINIYRTLTEALTFKNSQMNTQFIFSGVQLIPSNLNKYIQVTNTPSGINLEDWTVKVHSVCTGEELGDITDAFMVESLTNSVNGNPQFVWSLTNIQTDFGWGLIYMKITQTLGETFYSTPFKITVIDAEKTARITYKQKRTEDYQSIGFSMWYREDDIKLDLTKYYEVSTETSVNSVLQTNKIELWRTELMPRNLLIELIQKIKLPYVYVNNIRASLFDAPEIPASTSQENFASLNLNLSFNYNDVYVDETVSLSAGDFVDTDWINTDFLIYT